MLVYRHTTNTRRHPGKRWYIKGQGVPLSDHQVDIMFSLLFRPYITIDELIEVVHPDPFLEPDWAEVSLRGIIFALNKRLPSLGYKIVTLQRKIRLMEVDDAEQVRRTIKLQNSRQFHRENQGNTTFPTRPYDNG